MSSANRAPYIPANSTSQQHPPQSGIGASMLNPFDLQQQQLHPHAAPSIFHHQLAMQHPQPQQQVAAFQQAQPGQAFANANVPSAFAFAPHTQQLHQQPQPQHQQQFAMAANFGVGPAPVYMTPAQSPHQHQLHPIFTTQPGVGLRHYACTQFGAYVLVLAVPPPPATPDNPAPYYDLSAAAAAAAAFYISPPPPPLQPQLPPNPHQQSLVPCDNSAIGAIQQPPPPPQQLHEMFQLVNVGGGGLFNSTQAQASPLPPHVATYYHPPQAASALAMQAQTALSSLQQNAQPHARQQQPQMATTSSQSQQAPQQLSHLSPIRKKTTIRIVDPSTGLSLFENEKLTNVAFRPAATATTSTTPQVSTQTRDTTTPSVTVATAAAATATAANSAGVPKTTSDLKAQMLHQMKERELAEATAKRASVSIDTSEQALPSTKQQTAATAVVVHSVSQPIEQQQQPMPPTPQSVVDMTSSVNVVQSVVTVAMLTPSPTATTSSVIEKTPTQLAATSQPATLATPVVDDSKSRLIDDTTTTTTPTPAAVTATLELDGNNNSITVEPKSPLQKQQQRPQQSSAAEESPWECNWQLKRPSITTAAASAASKSTKSTTTSAKRPAAVAASAAVALLQPTKAKVPRAKAATPTKQRVQAPEPTDLFPPPLPPAPSPFFTSPWNKQPPSSSSSTTPPTINISTWPELAEPPQPGISYSHAAQQQQQQEPTPPAAPFIIDLSSWSSQQQQQPQHLPQPGVSYSQAAAAAALAAKQLTSQSPPPPRLSTPAAAAAVAVAKSTTPTPPTAAASVAANDPSPIATQLPQQPSVTSYSQVAATAKNVPSAASQSTRPVVAQSSPSPVRRLSNQQQQQQQRRQKQQQPQQKQMIADKVAQPPTTPSSTPASTSSAAAAATNAPTTAQCVQPLPPPSTSATVASATTPDDTPQAQPLPASSASSSSTCWTPENTEGLKRYDRDFMLSFRNKRLSLTLPDALAKDLADIGCLVQGHSTTFGPGGVQVINLNRDVSMRRAENPYVVASGAAAAEAGNSTERSELEALKRDVRNIVNKITPDNLVKMTSRLIGLPVTSEERLVQTVHIVFEKAVNEPAFAALNAALCKVLSYIEVPAASGEPNQIATFGNELLDRCRREFHADLMADYDKLIAQAEACADEDGGEHRKQKLREQAEEKLGKAKRRSLGNIRFIGEMFKLDMIAETIMHDCIERLLRQPNDEESIACLCHFLTTIGKSLDTPTNAAKMKSYFERLQRIVDNKNNESALSLRVRFTVMNLLDLWKSAWVPRRQENVTPRRLEDIRAEVEEERHTVEVAMARDQQHERNTRQHQQQHQQQRQRGLGRSRARGSVHKQQQ